VDVRAAVWGGVALGAAVASWQLLSAAALPGTPLFVPVAVGIQFAVTAGLLSTTARRQDYRAQLATGTVAGVIGAAIVAATSLLVTTVLYPGLAEAIGSTPTEGAITGALGTVSTGLVTSAGLALIFRRPTA
jgi:hypothetical protein